MTLQLVTVSWALVSGVSAIWPPPHDIRLDDSETFVISDDSDDLFGDEDEMIPVGVPADKRKYFRLHQMALRHNKREWGERAEASGNVAKVEEHNFDLDEPAAWEGGFVNRHGEFIHPDNEKVYYLNEMAKSLIDSKIEQKRENEKESETEKDLGNYDYNRFKAEYKDEIEKKKNQKDTYNYTDVKEDESLGDAVQAVVSFKEAKNCTAEKKKGIGIAAFKCILIDIQTAKSKNSILHLIEKILRVALIWFCVYVIIAVPCWCTRGWCCCCCCCCKICNPRRTIDEAKRFVMLNPVGTFHTRDDQKVEYPPTDYEIYSQRMLENALFDL